MPRAARSSGCGRPDTRAIFSVSQPEVRPPRFAGSRSWSSREVKSVSSVTTGMHVLCSRSLRLHKRSVMPPDERRVRPNKAMERTRGETVCSRRAYLAAGRSSLGYPYKRDEEVRQLTDLETVSA